ncbi:MAG: bifunctional transaldolase/phosoglucose isomerase [Acidobacteria bacterium]|nr:bifunctional transaldolase/phosoglucose isomerase [Acidobacteriota bacterium]
MNPLLQLRQHGQSVWLDYIRRHLLTSGDLRRLVEADGLGGLTSNPAIFEKAIAGSSDYDAALRQLAARGGCDPKDAYESLAIEDVRNAAAVLREVYDKTGGRDGYVSFEVSPLLAHDTGGTVGEARRLWSVLGSPNAMIKVPATAEGISAIRTLVADGINVNVTLLFALEAYEAVAEAFMSGLEARAARGGDIGGVASVASFFISRIDVAADARIAERAKAAPTAAERAAVLGLSGRVAIANAKLAYERYQTIVRSPRWQALAARGARSQRLLWASTGTKNPAYRDTLYVEALVGPETVNTMPPATLDAVRDHGAIRPSLEEDVEGARRDVAALANAGISLDAITADLLNDALRLFEEPFRKLLDVIDEQLRAARPTAKPGRQTFSVPPAIRADVDTALDDWQTHGSSRRLWARDADLWTGGDEHAWLGWLDITEAQEAHVDDLRRAAAEVRADGFTAALLLGMGGSSLCPDVLRATFGRQHGAPDLHVLDSTDPAQIARTVDALDLTRTLVVVSSKSGSTLEPNILFEYVFERIAQAVGVAEAPGRFVAITDPGSGLHQLAERRGFRRVFLGRPSIGGRYSALSDFGLAPAALMGVDVVRLLDRAGEMVQSCAACVPARDNPGAVLGILLGTLATHGRDKVTIVASPAIASVGAWLEQLLAESTGKQGKGLIPVDGEDVGPAGVYGQDRVFVYLRLESAPDAAQDQAIAALDAAGHAVIRIGLADPYDLAAEFFRWEMATAVAGAVIGIHPFDQPDVEASKIETRRLTTAYEQTGALLAEEPFLVAGGVRFFADPANARAIEAAMAGDRSPASCLRAHLSRLATGDYLACLAYLDRRRDHEARLQTIRHRVRERTRAATCVGFGPRFLHSTGQAYKGGPNSGVFLQITCEDATDVPVPGRRYSFGTVKAAQAQGDFAVLAARGRRALRVHLGPDVAAGLDTLTLAVDAALGR